MDDLPLIESLEAAAEADPERRYAVRGADLKRWAEERRRLIEATNAEREACARIAEEQLNRLYHGHGATGDQLIFAIIEEIRRRATP